jgi:ParB-like chromosome segregation protein Spo0J
VAQIAASIREFGFVNPILIAPDGRIIAGEARFLAAQSLGMPEVPVVVLAHLSDVPRSHASEGSNKNRYPDDEDSRV